MIPGPATIEIRRNLVKVFKKFSLRFNLLLFLIRKTIAEMVKNIAAVELSTPAVVPR